MSCQDVSTLTVTELKKILRDYGLQTSGVKTELITRLLEYDPTCKWADTIQKDISNETVNKINITHENHDLSDAEINDPVQIRREMILLQREKEIADRELELVKRELALMQENRRYDGPEQAYSTTVSTRSQVGVKTVAELLGYFDGTSEDYPGWARQVRVLQSTYKLDDDETRVLIGMRLRGKARDWVHSRSDFIELRVDDLLTKLGHMFYHRPSNLLLRTRLQERMWERNESFEDYFHDKIIRANRVPIDDERELVEYIIEGIPDRLLKMQAKMHCFETPEALLRAFEQLTLSSVSYAGNSFTDWRQKRTTDRFDGGKFRKDTRKCFICNEEGHLSANCLKKQRGPRCFQCGQHGHIAPSCPERDSNVEKTVNLATESPTTQSCKTVRLNNLDLMAMVDTASDLSLMKASCYVTLGAPCLKGSGTTFVGIGSNSHKTLGKFVSSVVIDECEYAIEFHVIPDTLLKYDLLLGADFLNTVRLIKNGRKIFIGKICEDIVNNCIVDNVPEVYRIECVCDDDIDVAHINDTTIQDRIKHVITTYTPRKIHEVNVEMNIVLKDEEPVYQRPRRLAPAEKTTVDAQLDDWLREGIIQPSLSEYASPIVLVKKKNGSMRLCVDYRKLNQKIVRDRYPLPLVEDQLDALQGAKIFRTLDLKNGFFHVPLNKDSRKFTSFVVPNGQYEFLRVPFGLCNSPAVFVRFVNTVFRDLLHRKTIMAYMDDLIIPSSDVDEGMRKLEEVLSVAKDHGLEINWRKCLWLRNKVEFLGHIIENGTVRPSEGKTLAVAKFPVPKTIKQVQSFLGLTGYFRKFIEGYSTIARPLTDLLRAGVKFELSGTAMGAFDVLKTKLIEKPVLKLYKVDAETELHADASSLGFGAILMQRSTDDDKFHPVYFTSGKTTPAEAKYASYELEVLAIVRSLWKFRVYLLGIRFKIVTDCKAFSLTMIKRDLCVRVARWALLLEEFNYIIEHRAGKRMAHVDALSRSPLPICYLLTADQDNMTVRIRKAQQDDSGTRQIAELVEQGKMDGYTTRGGLLFKIIDGDISLVVPKNLQLQVIRHIHENGHFSAAKTETLLKRDYWFQGIRPKIEKAIKNCLECILAERKKGKLEGFLNPIAKGEVPLDTYHVDHMGPLPSTRKSYRYIFVIVDAFTKFIWLYTTKTTNTAEVLRHLEKQAITFGNPRRIVSDRGTAFTSTDFQVYCQEEKIQHLLIAAGVPRGNGQVERVNRTLIPLLTKLAAPHPEEWYRYLYRVQRILNATPHRSVNATPFDLLFGTRMRARDDSHIREILEEEWVTLFQEQRNEVRSKAKEAIVKIQEENRRSFNKKRKKAVAYKEGDLVAIRRTQFGPGLKLAAKYLGPYRVTRILRHDRYMVEKIGSCEGPQQTTTVVDSMKSWINDNEDDTFENDLEIGEFEQDGCNL